VIDATAIPLSLYIHIPWCVKKCPYCDFNSHEAKGRIPEREYADALLADFAQECHLAQGRRIGSVFFGGGTPSLFAPATIARILAGTDALVPFAANAEVTLETNPGTVEHGRLDGYRDAGVNRISFGVQSFDDDALARLGRILRLAHGVARDLDEAFALAPTHVSHYQLTLEPNTLFAAKPPRLPDDDAAWSMQEHAQAALAGAGYTQYEVSAYARGDARCAHNLNYWHFGDYFGIGAGAHAKLTQPDGSVRRSAKKRMPRSYIDTAAGAARLASDDPVPAGQLPFEFMLNALRLDEPVELAGFEARTGLPRATLDAPLRNAQQRGWLEHDEARVVTTPLGRRFLNDVIEGFLP